MKWFRSLALPAISLVVWLCLPAHAFVAPPEAPLRRGEMAGDQGETAPDQQEPEEPQGDRPESEIIPFPVILSDPTNGFGAGGGLLTLYMLNETDPKDSQSAIFGYYTTTSSWKWGFQQVLSFAEDRFRSTTTGVFGNTNNSFSYADLPSDVAYGQRENRVETDFTYNVFSDLFVGITYRYSGTEFRFDVGSEEEQEFSEAVLGFVGAEDTTDSGLGVVVEFDSRDTQYTPTAGAFANFRYLDYGSWLGSDNNYRTVDTFFNYYYSFVPGHLLAFRFRWRSAGGDVPFTGQSTFEGVDLRAYPSGKYRGQGTLAGQLEYRFDAWKRLGGVAFVGTGRVYGGEPTLGANQVLPSGGAGLRFLLLKDRGAQVGLDYARGRFGNQGIYFFFDEAF